MVKNDERRLLWPAISVLLPYLLLLAVGLCGGFHKVAHAADGLASYYTANSCAGEAKALGLKGSYWGSKTANGEAYDEKAMTCALPRRDFGKEFVVYGEQTKKSIVVRHNDFGPGRGPRKRGVIIDLSPAAFKEVCGDLSVGRCQVSVQEVLS